MVQLKLELPEGYLDEEEREGYLVSHEMKQVWAVQLDLFNELMRVCQKNNIQFFVDSGTLLGAVRHGGYIPWDDDIDIVMTRAEYVKLENVAQDEFQYPYFWQTERTDLGSMRGHAQLRNSETTAILKSNWGKGFKFNQGIFIDIFPMDNVPENGKEREIFFSNILNRREKARHNAYFTSRFKEKGKGIKRWSRNLYHSYLMRVKKKNSAYEKYEKVMTTYDGQPTKDIGKLFFNVIKDSFIWESDWLMGSKEMQFEMFKVPVPIFYDEALTRMFGEWRTPTKDKTYHGDIIFDVDKSYKEFIE